MTRHPAFGRSRARQPHDTGRRGPDRRPPDLPAVGAVYYRWSGHQRLDLCVQSLASRDGEARPTDCASRWAQCRRISARRAEDGLRARPPIFRATVGQMFKRNRVRVTHMGNGLRGPAHGGNPAPSPDGFRRTPREPTVLQRDPGTGRLPASSQVDWRASRPRFGRPACGHRTSASLRPIA